MSDLCPRTRRPQKRFSVKKKKTTADTVRGDVPPGRIDHADTFRPRTAN